MENKQKQTAVEWLEEQLISSLGIELTKHQKKLFNDVFIKQAKEMEKQQIIDAYYIGNHCEFQGGSIVKEMGKRYYLKQYEKTTNN